ncbi:MAG: hypothetical protein CMB48_02985 [Euryarchaeota archaeon]|nr:hypothetical protein [Euryarchaeota archaeon]
MGDCELCGAMTVSTKRVKYHKSTIESCIRCIEKMNLSPAVNTSGITTSKTNRSRTYGSRKNLDNKKILVDNFPKLIISKRNEYNWTKKDLAEKASVRLIDIQNIESGKILEDKVVQKIEKTLNIVLFTEDNSPDYRKIKSNRGGGMTLGDFLNENGR